MHLCCPVAGATYLRSIELAYLEGTIRASVMRKRDETPQSEAFEGNLRKKFTQILLTK